MSSPAGLHYCDQQPRCSVLLAQPVAIATALHCSSVKIYILGTFTQDYLSDPGGYESMLEPNLESGRTAFSNRDYGQALDLLLPFAMYGQAEAQCMVASIYHWGLGRQPDIPKAVEWYRQAAHQSYGIASNNLAKIIAQGYGSKLPDPEAANHLYQKAQEQGWGYAPKALVDLMV